MSATNVVDMLQKALEVLYEPAKGPQPKDLYRSHQWEMAGAHAMFINSLLGIYEQAPTVPKKKSQDFASYALVWCAILHHHHTFEEDTYFRMFEPKYRTAHIAAEHDAFHDGVAAFEDYLVSCLPSGKPYGDQKVAPEHDVVDFDGYRIRELIEAFADPLVTHLQQEITYLDPEKLRAAGLTVAELQHIHDVEVEFVKKIPPQTFLTFVVLTKPKWCDGWPPAPWLLKAVIIPYVFTRFNTHLWQFVPRS